MSGGRWTLEQLNAMDQPEFTRAVGGIFEQSPWIVREAWQRRPFPGKKELHARMCAVIGEADEDAKLALLRAHPDLGARIAMTDQSRLEQAGAGLDRLSRREFRYLTALNRLYREKFRFPFIIAVKGKSVDEIISAMRRRIRNPREEELRQALAEVERIAGFRLDDLLNEGYDKEERNGS
ncbi:MAG: decarboxylase [Paenibacillaceae bacterium]|jgi:2-oxo-4-hydroxy-4-carboxy-5-ureidoimidazoline decarboxylase|nr:decarboxylase [Paenibacillaceae bacterium]